MFGVGQAFASFLDLCGETGVIEGESTVATRRFGDGGRACYFSAEWRGRQSSVASRALRAYPGDDQQLTRGLGDDRHRMIWYPFCMYFRYVPAMFAASIYPSAISSRSLTFAALFFNAIVELKTQDVVVRGREDSA